MATGQNSIIMNMNSFVWVSKKQMGALGGARLSLSAILPIANNSVNALGLRPEPSPTGGKGECRCEVL